MIWLAQSRSEKIVKLKIRRAKFASTALQHHFHGQPANESQVFAAAAATRAPPSFPV